MFPIRDHNPSERTPYVTYGLIGLNVLIFISYFPLFSDERALMGFFDLWAMRPIEISQGQELHTLVTSMFLHGGIMHLLSNMLFLYIFGDNLEDQFGHIPFLLFYLVAGVGADLGQLLWEPSSPVPNVGASGAIAGVMGGYLLLFPRARVDILLILIIIFRVFPVPAWIMLGLWFALQVFGGISSGSVAGGGVAYWAHAGGFVIGLVLTIPLWLRRGGPEFWQRTEGAPPHPEVDYSRSSIPRVRRR